MQVYADQAATTKISERALQAMMPCYTDIFGNPSSLHEVGRAAEEAVEKARKSIASAIGAEAGEVYFTSGGSEADNWAITMAAQLGAKKGKKHLISSAFEHHAVLHTLDKLKKEGFEVTLLPVHEDGLVRPEELEAAIREDTALVTIMFVNNEVGTIQPIEKLGEICRQKGVLFHTDAVQAAGHLPIDVKEMKIDMLSMAGHKFHGPKGVGALFVRKGIAMSNLISGGGQEKGKRAGTENVPAIVGMAEALRESLENREEKNAAVLKMRKRLTEAVLQIPKSRLNGDPDQRIAGNMNFCFEGIEGESLLLYLDLQGICASSGSACTSGSLEPSHVLLALGVPVEIAHGSLRISLDESNTEEEVDYILQTLPGVVKRLREMSPMWEHIQKGEV
ncbi:MAG: cysteine desulfurase NifS [Lachnospiraceae bacterium]|nr:cysteine desulfurase NifS [Lachnospiraceae bacterium]